MAKDKKGEKAKKVVITIGLPGSGKSTWAMDFLRKNDNFVRVSRDDFRFMLKNSPKTEPHIEHMIDGLCKETIMHSLKMGQSVIFDNTNLNIEKIEEICSMVEYLARVEFMLFDASVKKCIENNAKRPKHEQVPDHVIEALDEKFKLLKDVFPIDARPKKPKGAMPAIQPVFGGELPEAVIFDIDGTIAIMRGREPHDYDLVHRDEINELVKEQAIMHRERGRKIIIMSGRVDSCLQLTKDWLDLHEVPYDAILMRKEGDGRRDAIVKEELYREHVEGKYNTICVYDDRLEVVQFWYGMGLFCFNVNQGNLVF
jgi:predicted kinase